MSTILYAISLVAVTKLTDPYTLEIVKGNLNNFILENSQQVTAYRHSEVLSSELCIFQKYKSAGMSDIVIHHFASISEFFTSQPCEILNITCKSLKNNGI